MTGKLKKKLDLGFGQPKGSQALGSRMTGALKNQLNLGFGQPKRFLSTRVQDDWQVKKET
jgi:hypothetical protein